MFSKTKYCGPCVNISCMQSFWLLKFWYQLYLQFYFFFVGYPPLYFTFSGCSSFRYSILPGNCLGKSIIGHGVNVVVWFVCSCHAQYSLIWTWTRSNAISASRTSGSKPPTLVLGDLLLFNRIIMFLRIKPKIKKYGLMPFNPKW